MEINSTKMPWLVPTPVPVLKALTAALAFPTAKAVTAVPLAPPTAPASALKALALPTIIPTDLAPTAANARVNKQKMTASNHPRTFSPKPNLPASAGVIIFTATTTVTAMEMTIITTKATRTSRPIVISTMMMSST